MIQTQLSPPESGLPMEASRTTGRTERAAAAEALSLFTPDANVSGCTDALGSSPCSPRNGQEPISLQYSPFVNQPQLERQAGAALMGMNDVSPHVLGGGGLGSNLVAQTVDEIAGASLSVADAQDRADVYFDTNCPFDVQKGYVPSSTMTSADLHGCTTSSSNLASCYQDTDFICSPKSCTWGELERPPTDFPFLLEVGTSHFSIEGFTCPAHVELVRAALWILAQAAEEDGFFDWLFCAFAQSTNVQHGAPNIDRLKELLLGNSSSSSFGSGPAMSTIDAAFSPGSSVGVLVGPFGGSTELRIREATLDEGSGMAGAADQGGSTLQAEGLINIDPTHPLFRSIAGQWNFGTDDEKTCAALRLSAVLGHELLHIVAMSSTHHASDDFRAEDECSQWHIFLNTYLWSFAARLNLPEANMLCCNFQLNTWFFSDCYPAQFFLDRVASDLGATLSAASCIVDMVPNNIPIPTSEDDYVCPTTIQPIIQYLP